MTYTCPSCKLPGLDMFQRANRARKRKGVDMHHVNSCVYACLPCLTAGGCSPGMKFAAPTVDVTSTNHPDMTPAERKVFTDAAKIVNDAKHTQFTRSGAVPAFTPLSPTAIRTACAAIPKHY